MFTNKKSPSNNVRIVRYKGGKEPIKINSSTQAFKKMRNSNDIDGAQGSLGTSSGGMDLAPERNTGTPPNYYYVYD